MKFSLQFACFSLLVLAASCSRDVLADEPVVDDAAAGAANPFFAGFNAPIAYGAVEAAHLTEYAEVVLADAEATRQAIREIAQPDFESVIPSFDAMVSELSKAGNNTYMLYWVSPDAGTRDAGLAAYKRIQEWQVDLYSDRDVFEKILAVSGSDGLDDSQRKLVDDLLKSMRHTGVDLEPEELARFKALNKELEDLSTQYSMNMNGDTSLLRIDEAGAKGLPELFKSRFATDDGHYEIPVISANRGPVLRTAADPETRRAFMTLYANRAAEENLPILDELVAKRHELAALMGHASYADYALELNMARTPDNVWNFLNDLTARTEAKAVADVERLREFRAEAEGINTDVPLQPWDTGYYGDLLKRVEYGVDSEKVREYLPMADALEGMMALYQELFDLEFRKVDLPSVWHESVEMYDVVADGRVTGRFYLDLYPREGKESHMYGVPLTPGRLAPEGREIPTAMLLGNFTPPTDDLPSLITHAELRTLFHEFGHATQHMFTEVEEGGASGLNLVEWDAVELASQFNEYWMEHKPFLKKMTAHVESGEPLDDLAGLAHHPLDDRCAGELVGDGAGALAAPASRVMTAGPRTVGLRELVAAAADFGISHPPGQPLAAIVLGAANLVPIGALAFRVAIICALLGARYGEDFIGPIPEL